MVQYSRTSWDAIEKVRLCLVRDRARVELNFSSNLCDVNNNNGLLPCFVCCDG